MWNLDQLRELVERAGAIYEGGNPPKALELLAEIQFAPEQKEDAIYARFLCIRGSAEAEMGQLDPATKSFEEALEYHRIRKQTSEMGLIYFNLGNVHKYASQLPEAEQNYCKAFEQFREASNPMMMAVICVSLGNMFANAGNWASVNTWLAELDALMLDDQELQPATLWSKRTLQVKLAILADDNELAIQLGRQAVDAAARAGVPTYQAESLIGLSVSLARQGEIREARSRVLKARELLLSDPHPMSKQLLREAQATLTRIENLALAFGDVSDSADEGLHTESSIAHKQIDANKETTESEFTPFFMVPLDGQNKGRFLQQLAGISPNEVIGQLCVLSHDEAILFPLDTPGLTVLDIGDPSTWNCLEQDWTVSNQGARALRTIAPQLCQKGLNLKSEGELGEGILHYCVALRLAIRYGLIEGLHVVTANLFIVAKQIVAEIKHACEPLIKEPGEIKPAYLGGNLIVGQHRENTDAFTDKLLDFIRAEASEALRSLQTSTASNPTAEEPERRLYLLRSVRRLESLTRQSRQQQLLQEICRLCQATGHPDLALETIYEELADPDMLEMLKYLALIEPTSSDSDSDPGAIADFQFVWELYLKWRPQVSQLNSPSVYVAAMLCLTQLEILRASGVAGGGAFGHRLSYEAAQFPARISRDLISTLIKGNRQQQLEALALAERTCSRALGDWMGRTHPNRRLMIRRDITRSVGEIESASISEIFSTAKETETAILYYVGITNGYVMWVIYPDGDWDCIHLDNINSDLLELFQSLPYSFGAGNFAEARSRSRTIADSKKQFEIDAVLMKIGDVLFPNAVRAKLNAKRTKRIALVADQMMQFVPFACLRLSDSEFLIDHFDVVYWPSLTTWILCSEAESVYSDGQPLECLVMGGPDFSSEFTTSYYGIRQQIQLEDLPGAREEALEIAKALGTEARIGAEARVSTIFTHYGEQNKKSEAAWPFVPVMHLATHGLTDTWDANQSFIAFTDDLLSADNLYTFDPGLRTRLVMLSCCQTAIGYTHPDSMLGLANAFLVVGACTVGSTLWNVDDSATTVLMSRFYEEIKRGQDVSAALRTAQNFLRSSPEWSHPFYWAPFKLSGSFSNPLRQNAVAYSS